MVQFRVLVIISPLSTVSPKRKYTLLSSRVLKTEEDQVKSRRWVWRTPYFLCSPPRFWVHDFAASVYFLSVETVATLPCQNSGYINIPPVPWCIASCTAYFDTQLRWIMPWADINRNCNIFFCQVKSTEKLTNIKNPEYFGKMNHMIIVLIFFFANGWKQNCKN